MWWKRKLSGKNPEKKCKRCFNFYTNSAKI